MREEQTNNQRKWTGKVGQESGAWDLPPKQCCLLVQLFKIPAMEDGTVALVSRDPGVDLNCLDDDWILVQGLH